MQTRKILSGLVLITLTVFWVIFAASTFGGESEETLTLSQTVKAALKANLGLLSSTAGKKAALSQKKVQRSAFLPSFSTTYRYTHNDDTGQIAGITISPKEEYAFVTTVTQPIFTGFSNYNRYKVASLGLDVARIDETLVRRQVIFDAQKVYFSLLKVQKLLEVARSTVTQIESQRDVAENYYKVGMTPLNDFLHAEVELANARQGLIVAQNNLENAQSDFNNLLRRPLNTPVKIADILDYTPFDLRLEDCRSEAERSRLEIKSAELAVEIARREVKLVQKDYYPTVNLEGNYFKNGTDWEADGGEGISDPSGWNVMATATWTFWQWGKTRYGAKEKQSRLYQAELNQEQVLDSIRLEVKTAYLRAREAEKAVLTVEKAVEQAKENFRINQERYKQQIATSTDVLIAQTLLARTTSNYYSALYDYKISKAALDKAMGREIIE